MKTPSSDRRSLYRSIEGEALKAAGSLASGLDARQGVALRLGVGSAPLFVGFALFIAEQSRRDAVEQLYFFTREGEFFKRVLEAVIPNGSHAGQTLVRPHLLEVSRLATFAASLRSVSIEEMMRLWSLYDSQSIFALARSLGMEPAGLETVCARHAIPIEETLAHPWLDARVKRLFQDPEFIRRLSEKIALDRAAALAYFEARGISRQTQRIGIVDIGWRGTIQDNLALMRPDIHVVGYYLGLQRFLNPQPPNGVKRAYGPDANRDLLHVHLLDAVSPMEMLCNSPLGSVMGYRLENGQPRAIRLIEPTEQAIHAAVVEHFQQGVLLACRHWASPIAEHGIGGEELREMACARWSALIERPDPQIAQAYAAIRHNDVFGVGCFVDKRIVPSPWSMVRGLFSTRDRQAVILYIKQTQWTPGLWYRTDLSRLHRGMLISALVLGRAYKRARMWLHYHRVTKRS